MKQDKAAVHYRKGGKHCHACSHFKEGDDSKRETMLGTCMVVSGPIWEHGLCDLFKWADMPMPQLVKKGLL